MTSVILRNSAKVDTETKRRKILVIDSDAKISDFIEDLLSFRYQILKTHDATKALTCVARERPDLVILELAPPFQIGLEVCRSLRNSVITQHIPILVHSSSADIDQLLQAFESGADDYVLKTARPKELIARIVAKMRRIEENEVTSDQIACGNLTLDLAKLEASIDARVISLSVLEFNLLRFFVENKERVVNRTQILESVWREAVVSHRTIDTHMVYLRKKLFGFDYALATVYGAGYILRKSVARTRWRNNTEASEVDL